MPEIHNPICQLEHKEISSKVQAVAEIIEDSLVNIEKNTKVMAETLKEFHADNKYYVQLLAGKKQVPVSIFALVILVMSALLVASEARFSGLNISVGTDGIEIRKDIGNIRNIEQFKDIK